MTDRPRPLSRRVFLGGVVVLPALAGLLAAAARADGSKASQESMHYQSSPKDGMQCSGCNFFIAGKDAASDGGCKIVEGSISPHGYCMAYSGKS